MSAVVAKSYRRARREALLAFGWVEGRNAVIEERFAEGEDTRLPGIVDGAGRTSPRAQKGAFDRKFDIKLYDGKRTASGG